MKTPISLSDLTDSKLRELLGASPVTVLVGSGISIWDPTNLPSGKAFSNGIFRGLFLEGSGEVEDPLGDELEKVFNNIPFENVMEQCPEPAELTRWLKQIYTTSRYNSIHKILAQALIEGAVSSIITTNYDCCLDQAITESVRSVRAVTTSPKRIVHKDDVDSFDHLDGCYFKIHGSADDTSGESLVFRLGHEGALRQWKQALLHRLLRKRTLLVIGYSGLDFEICPEMPLAKPHQIIWNFRSLEDISPSARAVMEQVPGYIVIGDMRTLLSRTFTAVDASIGTASINVESLLKRKFSPHTRQLWRVKLLNCLSYGKAALKEIETLLTTTNSSSLEKIWGLEEQARAFHYLGAYKSAALAYESAISLARLEGLSPIKVCLLLLDTSDNWRCFGARRKSLRRIDEARSIVEAHRLDDPELLASLALKELLILRRKYQFATLLKVKPIKQRMQRRAELLIKSAAQPFLASGSWFNLQQLRLWTDRFDLPSAVIAVPDSYEAPPPRQGYEHLGFPMAQMMVFRDELDTGKRPLDEATAKELFDKVRFAERLGLNAEVWKLNYSLLKKFPSYRNGPNFKRFVKCFRACEYSFTMRIALLIIRP